MVHVFVLMLCAMVFSVNAMETNESQLLLANIQEMQLYHQSHDQSVLQKFERVLHLPIQPTEKQTQYITIAMEALTKHDYWQELATKNLAAYNHTQNSVVWTFAQLPRELQYTVISMMMGYDKDGEKSDEFVAGDDAQQQLVQQQMALRKIAVEVFVQTPFLHAIDRWSTMVALREQNEQLQESDGVDLFVTKCPYSLPIYVNVNFATTYIWKDYVACAGVTGLVGFVLGLSVGACTALGIGSGTSSQCLTWILSPAVGGCAGGLVLGNPLLACICRLNKQGMCCCIPGAVLQYKMLQKNENADDDEDMCCTQWIKKIK